MILLKSMRPLAMAAYVGRPLVFLLAFDLAVAAAYVFAGWHWIALPDVPLSIFGGVIGILVSFRNSSAYARWWEARTAWGGIVNHSRSFARQVLSMVEADRETQHKLVLLQISWADALRRQLRGGVKIDRSPIALQVEIAGLLAQCHRRGWLDSVRWASLDRTLGALVDCQGASERIKNTPMPRQYDFFIRLFIALYCLVLPLGMVQSLGLLTPVGSTFVGFIFLAVDQIGRDLENPFENLPNDVPLSAITRTIEVNLKEMLGEAELPEPMVAVDGVLW